MKLFTGAKKDAGAEKGAGAETQVPVRVADDVAVKRAQEALDGCRQQVGRLATQHEAAQKRLAAIEAAALEAEQRGDNPAEALDGARRGARALASMLEMAEGAESRAQVAWQRSLSDARARLAPAHLAHITALLDELERALWRVREQQDAIHDAVGQALSDGVKIGISGSRVLEHRISWLPIPAAERGNHELATVPIGGAALVQPSGCREMLTELAPGSPGTRAAIFGRCLAKDEARRLCEAVASTGAATLQNGRMGRPVMNAAAADLSLVEAGDAALLVEHDRSLDALVGIVEAAWFEAGCLRTILRYGTSAKAEAVWRAVCDNLPVRVSMGFRTLDIELPEEDDDPILFTRCVPR